LRKDILITLRHRAPVIIIFLAGLILWELLSGARLIPSYLLPSPSSIASEFMRPEVNWPEHIFVTLKEIAVGFVFGAIGGILLAAGITEYPVLRRTILPYVVGIEALPKIAVIPIIYILLGFNDLSRIIMVILLTFFPIVLSTSNGLVDIDKNLIYLMQTLGASRGVIFYKVKLPSALPQLFVGLRLGILGAVVGSVIAEFVSSSAGLGFLIINAQNTFDTSLGFAAFAVLAFMSLSFYATIEIAARTLMPWFRQK